MAAVGEMKYWQRRKQARLYKQWAEHAELPSEAMPSPEVPTDMKVGMDVRTREREGDWFYLFRVKILDIVRKILKVD